MTSLSFGLCHIFWGLLIWSGDLHVGLLNCVHVNVPVIHFMTDLLPEGRNLVDKQIVGDSAA